MSGLGNTLKRGLRTGPRALALACACLLAEPLALHAQSPAASGTILTIAVEAPSRIPFRSWGLLWALLLGLGSFLCARTTYVVTNTIGGAAKFYRLHKP